MEANSPNFDWQKPGDTRLICVTRTMTAFDDMTIKYITLIYNLHLDTQKQIPVISQQVPHV